MNRREFLRIGAGILGAGALGIAGCGRGRVGGVSAADDGPAAANDPGAQQPAKVGKNRFQERLGELNAAIATGENRSPAELVSAALAALGSTEALINAGDTVVIKPNLAWDRPPEQATCVSAEVLSAVIQACQQAGPSEVLVVEHSCDKADFTFDVSGAKEVCSGLGVPLISLDNESLYQEVELPQGVNIKRDQIARDILECDVLINVPILKVHSATGATVAMKNQMGAVYDRQRYHRTGSSGQRDMNLHQNIADLATGLRPTLNIVDATRALTTNGPTGPGLVEQIDTIIAGSDIVAVDALGAKLLGLKPADIGHIRLGAEAGLGEMDEAKMKLARV